MKINRKNPEHIAALAASSINSIIAVCARLIIRKKPKDKVIIFYGHTLNGNLKAFYDYLLKKRGYAPYFLVLDKHYYRRLKKQNKDQQRLLSALSIKDMLFVAKADAFITSHGLHMFFILRFLTNIKFIDVWHAVSYKGFSENGFNHLHRHDQSWVSSEDMKKLYVERYGFKREQIEVTGYGRTDQLVNGSLSVQKIINKYKIPKAKKYVLIAPTWKQDDSGRSLLPFGVDQEIFFGDIDKIAKKNSAHIIFRTHLNSTDDFDTTNLTSTSFMPYSKYEVVEDFLYIADVLVTDWSSVGIDFLPLKRPTIFLDVQAPFKHGFNMGSEHRFGDVVASFTDFKEALSSNLRSPESFIKRHSRQMKISIRVAYGDTLDGHSCDRYYANLKKILQEP